MRKRLIAKFTRAREGTWGYTMMEVLTVIGIIAIVCAIAIPSFLALRRSMAFSQANDYAKSIFLAAQQNLTALRADGALGPLQSPEALGKMGPPKSGFPEEYAAEYYYISSEDEGHTALFNMVLPTGTIDDVVRREQIIIEFNPLTGNVYAVFYCDQNDVSLLNEYTTDSIDREDASDRKKNLIGYYDGTGLNSSGLNWEETKTQLSYYNGQEGILEIRVPIPEVFHENPGDFKAGLVVELTITGQQSGNTIPLTVPATVIAEATDEVAYENKKYSLEEDYGDRYTADGIPVQQPIIDANSGQTLVIAYPLDSLRNHMSFANLATETADKVDETGATVNGSSLTSVTEIEGDRLLPGENVDIEAHISFEGSEVALDIETGILPDVNPFFHSLGSDGTGNYILYVSNGRHLQNLNALAPEVAEKVSSVQFRNDIYWNKTVNYYNDEHGTATPEAVSASYKNAPDEAPARSLPYFVPIHNEALLGTARFVDVEDDGINSWGDLFNELAAWLFGTSDNGKNSLLLTDELDLVGNAYQNHAVVEGNGFGVYNLDIDANQYTLLPDSQQGRFYAMGENQVNDYYFTGLFAYANTTINNLSVVNPIIRGHEFVTESLYVPRYDGSGKVIGHTKQEMTGNNPATGALLGAGGFNTLLTNCNTYIDVTADGFIPMYQVYSQFVGDSIFYGVKGSGAVGGLVGFCKSHKSVNDDLPNDDAVLVFSRCFAAVNVRGKMRGTNDENYGYTNGVGGLLGNSQITNFYNCYASGNVIASGNYVEKRSDADEKRDGLKLQYNGYTGQGIGGFVGTSHGTHYTNCFSTGNVQNEGTTATLGVGGFVGFMSIDESVQYKNRENGGTSEVEQHTVFTNCYSVGETTANGSAAERFSGANGRVGFDMSTIVAGTIGDYYRLYAPEAFLYNAEYAILYKKKADLTSYKGPEYEDFYTYRDSYYLSEYLTDNADAQANSNGCAAPLGYTDFVDMTVKHTAPSTWITTQINTLKTELLSDAYIKGVLSGSTLGGEFVERVLSEIAGNTTIEEAFFDGFNDTLPESVKVIISMAAFNWDLFDQLEIDKELTAAYKRAYSEGFPSEYWEDSTGVRVSYHNSGVYPFTKLKGLDYYGDWPSRPGNVGLAYYETYSDGKTHYLFDRDRPDGTVAGQSQVLSLRTSTDENAVVRQDGYVIFAADTTELKIRINNQSFTLARRESESHKVTATQIYNVYDLSKEALAALEAAAKNSNEFYVTVEVQQNGVTYTMYVNPYVAQSHINPDGDDADHKPIKPQTPSVLSIRSARQFANLSKLSVCFTQGTTFLQELNIDAAAYDWNRDGKVEKETIPVLSPIGTSQKPFQAAYRSSVYKTTENGKAEVVQAQITGFTPAAGGFFGTIGDKGSLENLMFTVKAAEKQTLTLSGAANAALVAGSVQGKLTNVDLALSGTFNLSGTENAGLLAGFVSGAVSDCQVAGYVDEKTPDTMSETTITLSAPNAGGYIGKAEGVTTDKQVTRARISGGELTLNGDLTFKMPDKLPEATTTAYFGGFLGSAKELEVEKSLSVSFKALTVEKHDKNTSVAGGLAGRMDNATLVKTSVTLNANAKNESGTLAGAIGHAEGVTLADATVTVRDITAKKAAGLLGETKAVTVQDCVLTLGTNVTGTEAAAGVVLTLGSQSKLTNVPLNLADTTISASGGKAAGFAVTIDGEATVSNSSLTFGKTTISGTEAAGFVHTLGGFVESSVVQGPGAITGTDSAAGYAHTLSDGAQLSSGGVTPAKKPSKEAYAGQSNAGLTVEAKNKDAALFILTVGKDATIRNCYALGTVQAGGNAYGFLKTLGSGSQLESCTTNVSLNGGYAFVGTNNGVVARCYGLYQDTAPTDEKTIRGEFGGNCYSTYLVSMDMDYELDNGAVLYDYNGAKTNIPAKELTEKLTALTGDTDENTSGRSFLWYTAGTYASYPYRDTTDSYPFPMLREHYGDWIVAQSHAYGLAYVEEHLPGVYAFHLVDLSDPDTTQEGKTVSGYYSLDTLENQVSTKDALGNTGPISSAGYYTFRRVKNDSDPELTLTLDGKTYAFTPLESDTLENYKVDKRFADAIYPEGETPAAYYVRTPEQFANIDGFKANFQQTHNIELKEAKSVTLAEGATYTAAEGVTLTADGTVFSDVKGTLTLNDVTINASTIDLNGSTRGLLANTNTGAITLKGDVTATATVTGSGTFGGLVGENSGSLSGGTTDETVTVDIRKAEDSTGTDLIIGGVIGKMTGGKAENITVNATLASGFATATANAPGETFGPETTDFPVGLFVGLADSGTFTGCKAEGTGYQFLGETPVNTENFTTEVWGSDFKETSVSWPLGETYEGFTRATSYNTIGVMLDNCSLNDSKVSYGANAYYYSQEVRSETTKYNATAAVPFKAATLTIDSDITRGTFEAPTATNFYMQHEDGSYGRIYAYKDGDTYFYYAATAEGTSEPTELTDSLDVWTFAPGTDGNYLLVNPEGQALGLNNATYPFKQEFYEGDELISAFWMWNNNDFVRGESPAGAELKDYHAANNVQVTIGEQDYQIYQVAGTKQEAQTVFTLLTNAEYYRQYLTHIPNSAPAAQEGA